jgi:hypothetical protein
VVLAETRSLTWDLAGDAMPNYKAGQEGVPWPSTALLDVDAGHVGDVWGLAAASSDAAAAGAWSDAGGVVRAAGEERPKCVCT